MDMAADPGFFLHIGRHFRIAVSAVGQYANEEVSFDLFSGIRIEPVWSGASPVYLDGFTGLMPDNIRKLTFFDMIPEIFAELCFLIWNLPALPALRDLFFPKQRNGNPRFLQFFTVIIVVGHLIQLTRLARFIDMYLQ